MKRVLLIITFALVTFVVAACGSGGKETLVIWVGEEVEDFYQDKMDEYVEDYNSTHSDEFPYNVDVRAADTGTAAGVFLQDIEAGPDILTVAHDNLGRLISGSSAIRPIQDDALLAQIEAQNTASFLDAIKANFEGTTYTFGVPYEAQALILYYNKAYLTEEDVQTWEGIWDVAKAENKQATTVTGQDGFNNSFLTLASFADTGEKIVSLYENGVVENTEFVNDGSVSVMQWGQRFFSDDNGAQEATDSGWQVDFSNEDTISLVGGAWHFRAAQAAIGDDLGVAVLPQFTITAEDAYGDVDAGTVMQSGTFTDTKMFVMNRTSEKIAYLEDILLYLTDKEVQEESFVDYGTLPAYKNALEEFEGMDNDSLNTQLAIAQLAMFEYGIPQPFGKEARFNVYYYQRQAPELLYEMLRNEDGDFDTTADIIERMEAIERIWLGIRDE